MNSMRSVSATLAHNAGVDEEQHTASGGLLLPTAEHVSALGAYPLAKHWGEWTHVAFGASPDMLKVSSMGLAWRRVLPATHSALHPRAHAHTHTQHLSAAHLACSPSCRSPAVVCACVVSM